MLSPVCCFYLCMSDTHVLHVCCELFNLSAELLKLLLQWLYLCLLALLNITIWLTASRNGAGYCCRFLEDRFIHITVRACRHVLPHSAEGRRSDLFKCELLGVSKVRALGQDVVRRGGAFKHLQYFTQVIGRVWTPEATFRRRMCIRAQLLLDAFPKSGHFSSTILLSKGKNELPLKEIQQNLHIFIT